MKVKCINDYWLFYLTIGKTYEVISENAWRYIIIDDTGEDNRYLVEWFKTLSELRNEKIDKLLEE